MEYTIKKLAQLSGVSTRTLRYYDEIELLKPARVNSSGYRIYSGTEVDRLQQILFYRSLDLSLSDIKHFLDQPDFDFKEALEFHREKLIQKRNHLDDLLLSVESSLAYHKGEKTMTDNEKFTAFKQNKLAENETLYGEEIRQKYGEKEVEKSNANWLNLSESDHLEMTTTEKALFDSLAEVLATKDLDSDTARNAFNQHKKWLSYSLGNYSPDIHVGLADMYVADERFTDYYDQKIGIGATSILCEIIKKYAN